MCVCVRVCARAHAPLRTQGETILSVYRPPSYKIDDDKKLAKNIENVSLINKETVLLGDFSVDDLTPGKFDKHFLIESLRSHNFKQLINEITRPLSKSCLDHVRMV